MYFVITNALIASIGTHIFTKLFFPKEYSEYLLFSSYKIIFLYSQLECYCKKIYNNNNLQKDNFIINGVIKIQDLLFQTKEIEMIKNNNVIFSTNKELMCFPLLCDFFIYSNKLAFDSTHTNKIIYFNIPDSYEYTLCDFKFMNITVYLDNEKNYTIYLHTSQENFYVVNNIINKKVIFYLLKQTYNLDGEDMSYKLSIIDNNTNIISITEKDIIILKDNTYDIVNEESFIYPISTPDIVKFSLKKLLNVQDIIDNNIVFSDDSDSSMPDLLSMCDE